MLRPQRGQFTNGAARRLASEISVLVINTTGWSERGMRFRRVPIEAGQR